MDEFFECVWNGNRFVGFGSCADGEPLQLYPVGAGGLRDALRSVAFDVGRVQEAIGDRVGAVTIEAGDRLAERSGFRFLPPLFPERPSEALVSGFGLSHKVKMPPAIVAAGPDGACPSWFFKGNGLCLKIGDAPLTIPPASVSVCEEAEIVLVFASDDTGQPRYVGHTFGNDLTDMGRIKRNPSHLSYAKLCDCAVSPRCFIGAPPSTVAGQVAVERAGENIWNGTFQTGTDCLFYPLGQMMDHLWSHAGLLAPGLVHYVFLGADRNSFDAGVQILDGDRIVIDVNGPDVRLANTIVRQGEARSGIVSAAA